MTAQQSTEEQLIGRERQVVEKEIELQKREEQFALLLSKVQRTIDLQKHKIKLNIGGNVFATTIDTLTSEKDTYFSAMFSEAFNTQPDEDGEFFIDRSPEYFPLILAHLRGSNIQPRIQKLSPIQRIEFTEEAKYYCIESILALSKFTSMRGCTWDRRLSRPTITFSNNDLTIAGSASGCITLASQRLEPNNLYYWEVTNDRDGSDTYIGVAAANVDRNDYLYKVGYCYQSSGYVRVQGIVTCEGIPKLKDVKPNTGAQIVQHKPFTLGVLVDMYKREMTFYLNKVRIENVVVTDLLDYVHPAVTIHKGQVTANFEAEPPEH